MTFRTAMPLHPSFEGPKVQRFSNCPSKDNAHGMVHLKN